ncbi:MoaD/ThiS family protein [Roseateles aquatilis]|uniref:MoaD/ThiS family protein n=1 Tax=Roseateles aquatilis TaxID=431061 RepID=UPI0011324ECA|nr:MoaD/ThiS family protein [Roseateles aquatilis]
MVVVTLPSQLAGLAGGRRNFELQAHTLSEVFERLHEQVPMIRSQIFDSSGALRQFVAVFVDGKQAYLQGAGNGSLHAESQVLIVLSVAGG